MVPDVGHVFYKNANTITLSLAQHFCLFLAKTAQIFLDCSPSIPLMPFLKISKYYFWFFTPILIASLELNAINQGVNYECSRNSFLYLWEPQSNAGTVMSGASVEQSALLQRFRAERANHLVAIEPSKVETPFDKAAVFGQAKVTKHKGQSFGLAIFAGAFIALAFIFYLTVTTGSEPGAWGLVRFSGGIAFSMGLILVVVLGGELFTSTVLSAIAWAQKRVTTGQLLGCWTRVYFGNLVGALLILTLVMASQLYGLDGNAWGLNALHVAQHKIHHSWGQAFALGTLCNLLVCLGVWMTFSCKDALAKALLLILPVAMFVSSGFEHSIANMFMVPLGIAVQNFAGAEFFTALNIAPQKFADLTIYNFVLHNLIPVTLGNILGGAVFVGLGYFWIDSTNNQAPSAHPSLHVSPQSMHAVESHLITAKTQSNAKIQYQPSQEDLVMKNKIQKLIVSELMDTKPLAFSIDTNIYQALIKLAEANLRSAPVVDKDKTLLGFVSEQDLMRSLWSEEFASQLPITMKEIMQTKMLTVTPTEKVVQLLEFMVVDKDKLFPVTGSGMYISGGYQSYEERLKEAAANAPSAYPVVENGRLCGVIRRDALMQMFAKLYSPKHDGITHPADHKAVA